MESMELKKANGDSPKQEVAQRIFELRGLELRTPCFSATLYVWTLKRHSLMEERDVHKAERK